MTLDQALAYLETTARVSCPQITCEQAAEIAELMRDLSDQHQVDIAEMVSWKIHTQALYERDEALKKLREVERERDEAKQRAEWCFEISEKWKESHDQVLQAACGFTWDAGREMARLEGERCADEFMAWLNRAGAHWKNLDWRKELGREIEVGEDCDASDYERPGR